MDYFKEEWKPIENYDGIYFISNYGRVYKKQSIITQMGKWGSEYKRTIKGQMITPTDNGNGYKLVALRKNGIRKNYYIHRLVASAFLIKPNETAVVNHKDFDRTNNNVTNLEWCSQKDNVNYSIPNMHKLQTGNVYSNSGERYITIDNRTGLTKYRVCNKKLGIDKCFKTIEEAINCRNEVMKKWRNQ